MAAATEPTTESRAEHRSTITVGILAWLVSSPATGRTTETTAPPPPWRRW